MAIPYPYMRWLTALIGTACLFSACTESVHTVERSFYYWKTVYGPDSADLHRLENVGAKPLFVRVMDVDTQGPQGEAIPVSAITFKEPLPDSVAIVPVVYIVNSLLKAMSGEQVGLLADRVLRFVEGKASQSGKRGFGELQIDCDWTVSTREPYFSFLDTLRERLADTVLLSATLRLHQVRNRRSSGIPPVDRVTLMCYNMGNLRKLGEHNSILDLQEMETYLNDFLPNYPLPTDIALPLFSWSVVFRNGEYAGISKRLDPKLLADTTVFAGSPGSTLYHLKTALPLAGLRAGDVVRREETRWDDLRAAADFLAAHKRKEDFTLLFYHLDNRDIQDFTDEQLQEIIGLF